MSRDAFHTHFERSFFDPAFDTERDSIARLEEIASQAYSEGRKAPRTAKAGAGFADPDYDLFIEWRATRDALIAAEAKQKDPSTRSRVLLIIGSGAMPARAPAKSPKAFVWQMQRRKSFAASDSMWTVSICLFWLPTTGAQFILANPASRQRCHSATGHAPVTPTMRLPKPTTGWRRSIKRWVAAHGVMVYWGQAPSGLKLMIDRLVCADGGNPDPSSTHGKRPEEAKALELAGWPYPKHIAGRVYGVAVHGDAGGVEELSTNLCDWLDWIGLIGSGTLSKLARYIGYFEPYATSHEALDRDGAVVEEVRNVARAVARAIPEMRAICGNRMPNSKSPGRSEPPLPKSREGF